MQNDKTLLLRKIPRGKKIIVIEIVNFQRPTRDETTKYLVVSHVLSGLDSAQ